MKKISRCFTILRTNSKVLLAHHVQLSMQATCPTRPRSVLLNDHSVTSYSCAFSCSSSWTWFATLRYPPLRVYLRGVLCVCLHTLASVSVCTFGEKFLSFFSKREQQQKD